MLFKPVVLERIITGRKTVTRRLTVHRDGKPLAYQANHEYAIQPGRGKAHVGHIAVWAVDVEPLGVRTPHQARGEGFPVIGPRSDDHAAVMQFEEYWRELHGDYREDELVAVIKFAYVGTRACCAPIEVPA